MAIDDAGTALVGWTKLVDFTRAQARTRTADGTLSPVMTLSSSGSAADAVDVAMAGSGATTGVVGWRRPLGGDVRMQIRRIAGGAWQSAETVSPAGFGVNELRVAMPADGSTVTSLFSTNEDEGALGRIRARRAARGRDARAGRHRVVGERAPGPEPPARDERGGPGGRGVASAAGRRARRPDLGGHELPRSSAAPGRTAARGAAPSGAASVRPVRSAGRLDSL